MNMGLGGGIFGAQGYTTFSPETINERDPRGARAGDPRAGGPRQEPSERGALVDRQRAGVRDGRGREDYFRPLFELTRELDPTRPVGFVNVMLAPYGTCRVSQFGDVLMLNRYYGWYVNTGDLAGGRAGLGGGAARLGERGQADHHHRVRRRHLPGLHAVSPQPWTEEYQVAYLEMNHRVFDRVDAVVGEQVWNFADFATTSGIMRVGGNKKGVFTRDRQPKAAAWALRRRWRGEK